MRGCVMRGSVSTLSRGCVIGVLCIRGCVMSVLGVSEGVS